MKQAILSIFTASGLMLAAPGYAPAHPVTPAAPITAQVVTGVQHAAPSHAMVPPGLAAISGARFEQRGHGGRAVGGRARVGSGSAGHASPRTVPFGRRVFFRPRFFSPFFSPFAFGGFGLGFAYDPFFWGWGSPYWSPYWGYPYGPWGYGYGYDYGYGDRRYGGNYEQYGSIKFDVRPKNAEVYADGYYMGQVRDFDGAFHHLDIAAGEHKIEIRASGYQPLTLNMKIAPGRTVSYKGDLQRGGTQ